MSKKFNKSKMRLLFGDILAVVTVGFLLVASLLVYESWFGGEATHRQSDKKIIESSSLKY